MINTLNKDSDVRGMKCLVASVEYRLTKQNKPYLAGVLMDDTGTIPFKVWDNAELFRSVLVAGTPVLIKAGACDEYAGAVSVKITQAEALPADQTDGLIRKAPVEYDRLIQKFNNTVERIKAGGIDLTEGLARLKQASVLDLFLAIPAARSHHHVYRHGLLQHTIEVVELAESMGEAAVRYQEADVNMNVLLTAALFHDLGKTVEYDITPVRMLDKFSIDGEMLGHHFLGAEMFDRAFSNAFRDNPSDLRAIKHCILSHHGKPEWGACFEPKTLEAFMVSQADLMSASVIKFTTKE